jgi:hypothetical protein
MCCPIPFGMLGNSANFQNFPPFLTTGGHFENFENRDFFAKYTALLKLQNMDFWTISLAQWVCMGLLFSRETIFPFYRHFLPRVAILNFVKNVKFSKFSIGF